GLDVIPEDEASANRFIRLRVRIREVPERLLGENHPPSKGVIGTVPFENRQLCLGKTLLHQDAEVEARRASSEDGDLHRIVAARASGSGVVSIALPLLRSLEGTNRLFVISTEVKR